MCRGMTTGRVGRPTLKRDGSGESDELPEQMQPIWHDTVWKRIAIFAIFDRLKYTVYGTFNILSL